MSKKKDASRMNREKDISKIMTEIQKHDFNSEDELNDFLSYLNDIGLDDLPERTDKKGRAEDLVFEAYEQPVTKGKKLVKQALELDPNNAEAYNYLASIEKDIDQALNMFEKAIKAGEKTLGKKFFKEEKGYFWGLFETRPYMRAKAGLASCFYVKKEIDKAIAIYEEMLELNPNDNQGIRYLLSPLLLSKNDLTSFENFIQNNEEEDCAVWNYNNALYSFKKFGRTTKSEKILLQAYNSNKFVIDYLLGIKEIPKKQPQYIGMGDEDEAVSYVIGAWGIWEETNEAFDWLYEFRQKMLKMN
ncbi:MAG: tetratricopeptide repeat protein [Bacteroidales bacterium]|nr:tetratricopeptide repeat protein [Bacteroidales bacterium]MDD4216921.1 tetratricopeptide repeat protein [Bacteroidales bacterium]MDY0141222.1 tetratricopeptide repeat protein [Bacteroidales bacterium]